MSLETPFKSLYESVGFGGAACVFTVAGSADIVVKVPFRFDIRNISDPRSQKRYKDHEDSAIKDFEHEMNVYKVLSTKPHQNVLQPFLLISPHAIFLPRMKESLESRLHQQNERPITVQMQHRWIKQIASGAAWLEHLDYFHCDFGPPNLLLDEDDHIKICDFGNAMERGEKIPGMQVPFYKALPLDHERLPAGPATEQFAIGSCIYMIRTGNEPLGHLDWPEQLAALVRGDYPSTDSDTVFGQIIHDCWHSKYETMAQVEQAIGLVLPDCECDKGASVMDPATCDARVADCRKFAEEKKKPGFVW